MSTEEADIHERFLGGTMRHVVASAEGIQQGPASESSSSSDGSNEPHTNGPDLEQDLNHSVTSILQRSQVTFETSNENTPAVSIAQSKQAGTWLTNCTLAKTSQPYPPGIVEASAQAGTFQSLNSQPDTNVSNQDQLFCPSQMLTLGSSFPLDQSLRTSGNTNGSTSNNNYHLPTSNLPLDFHLESSSRSPVSQMHHPYFQALTTMENGNNGSLFMRTQWSNIHPQHQISMHEPSSTTLEPQEYSFQGLLGPTTRSTNFHLGRSTHPIQYLNMPAHKIMELSLPPQSDGMPTDSNGKMKMIWQDNILSTSNLHPVHWIAQGQGSRGQNFSVLSASNSRYLRNSIYDPIYEAMGLPVDPHLRMFIARRNDGGNEG